MTVRRNTRPRLAFEATAGGGRAAAIEGTVQSKTATERRRWRQWRQWWHGDGVCWCAAGRVDTIYGAGSRAHLSKERVHPEPSWRRPASSECSQDLVGKLLCSPCAQQSRIDRHSRIPVKRVPEDTPCNRDHIRAVVIGEKRQDKGECTGRIIAIYCGHR